MAKIQEEKIVVKLSKLLKASDDGSTPLASDDLLAGLEQIGQELVEVGIIVEVEVE